MKKRILFLALLVCTFSVSGQSGSHLPRITAAGKGIANTRIDNIGYWKRMVDLGYALPTPFTLTKPALRTGRFVFLDGRFAQDSPDVPVTAAPITTQSENSIFADPLDEDHLLNSNNSTDWDGSSVTTLHGSGYFLSTDGAQQWNGSVNGPDQDNMGDPATAIGADGRMYIGSISANYGQVVAWSADNGAGWHEVTVSSVPSPGNDILDKNHLWIDNSESSAWKGNVYDAWSCFVSGSLNENDIELSRSVNGGLNWTTPLNLSTNVNAGSHNQGVNLKTGPDGEVYAVWSIYDSWPSDESAIGFARSVNGGSMFPPATRIIDNIRGIRTTGTTKAMRVNSFPCMAVDLSDGPYRGYLYVVWANIGTPGINTGTDIDVYMIKSADNGTTWSAPMKVNQSVPGAGKNRFFPWITCDPDNGNLAVVYYDDRNTDATSCETWVSYSYDAGETWEDMKVSDISFTPGPIAGLAPEYFGDYLGITSKNMKVYPVWTDNRSGTAMAYVSPVDLGPAPGQPYVMYHQAEVTPITKSDRTGMNFGDSLWLTLTLKNVGDQPSLNTMAYLSCSSSYIIITDSTENYGDMNPGEIRQIANGFSFKVSDTIPDGLRPRFDIRATDGTGTWYSHFTLEAHAPALKIIGLSINDTAGGNHNGRLDPGETVQVKVSSTNTGDFTCENTWGRLTTLTEDIGIAPDSIYIGTLNPGDRRTVAYTVVVGEEVSAGTPVDLTYTLHSGLYRAQRTFTAPVGLFVEDWETGDFLKFPWLFSGDMPWMLTTASPYEGVYSARSGPILDYSDSKILITYTSGADDSISFYRKVSSESGYDFLNFYIDSQLQGAWSGEKPWERFAFPVSAGVHNFTWEYQKDIYLNGGQDAAWIDYIAFPPPVLPVVNMPRYDTLCAGELYHAAAEVSGQDSLRWTTLGDGIFSSDTIPEPVYTPGSGDVSAGSVKLRLSAYGPNGKTVHSTTLSIGSYPDAAILALPNDTLCTTQPMTLSVDPVQGASYLWKPGSQSTPEITLDAAAIGGAGSRWIGVTVTSAQKCASSDSARVTFRDCTGIDDGEDSQYTRVHPNPTTGAFTVSLYSKHPAELSVQILNALNEPVSETETFRVSGKFSREFQFGSLPAGVYLLVIDRNDGTAPETVKVVKTK